MWGVSAWGARLREAKQVNLGIARDNTAGIVVDNIAFASLFSRLEDSSQFRDLIDALTQKCVLILGRFSKDQKPVLDTIRSELRKYDYLPIMLDFGSTGNRTIIEAVNTLAGVSRFLIADLTNARSVLQELVASPAPSLACRAFNHQEVGA